jgi:hypothetical protein
MKYGAFDMGVFKLGRGSHIEKEHALFLSGDLLWGYGCG